MRDRITVTLRKEIIKEVDRLINNLTIRSRSHAIEYLLTKMLSRYQVDSALIVAGGPNDGFKNSSSHKTMQTVKNKPILENILLLLRDRGIKKFVFVCDHMADQIMKHFSDGKKFGVDIKYVVSKEPQGRALAIKSARNYFDKAFLVWYGDILCKFDLADMIRTHSDTKALATIALTTVSNPLNYGVVKMKGNRIKDFVEKPKKRIAESFLVSSGIFLAEPEIFKYINSKMKSLETDLFPRLAKKNLLIGYPFEGLWLNVNDKNELQKANALWK